MCLSLFVYVYYMYACLFLWTISVYNCCAFSMSMYVLQKIMLFFYFLIRILYLNQDLYL